MANLNRFIQAQNKNNTYDEAYAELQNGRKHSHWIWFIFPQLKGLGESPTDQEFGIDDLKEACAYLKNKELFDRYQKITHLVSQQLDRNITVLELMGTAIDVKKLASSMSLFYEAALFLNKQANREHHYEDLAQSCAHILSIMKQQGYSSCQKTLEMLAPQINQCTKTDEGIQNLSVQKNTFFKQKIKDPDYLALSNALDEYIRQRTDEWSFHYNFLGFVSLLHKIEDFLLGTDYFTTKYRETKISAARKLKEHILHPEDDSIVITSAEKKALMDGRLKKTIAAHGHLEDFLKSNPPHIKIERSTGQAIKP